LRRDVVVNYVSGKWIFGIRAVGVAKGNSRNGRGAEGLGGSEVDVVFGASSASEGVVGSAIAL
jgi:hypothetical protein